MQWNWHDAVKLVLWRHQMHAVNESGGWTSGNQFHSTRLYTGKEKKQTIEGSPRVKYQLGSPAGPDGAKMSFGHSPARHLHWETKSHKTFSWNKGKSILFHTISPSHYIWLSLFLKSCSSYLELSSYHINLPQQKTFTYHSPLPFLNRQIVCTHIPGCVTSHATISLQPLDGDPSIRVLPCWGILKYNKFNSIQFLNLYVHVLAHLIPPHFLDYILKSRNILALALYDTNI